MRTIILLILSALIFTACSAPHSDARLDKIAASIDSIPESALKALAEINRDSLPEADRHYLDLLTIKAADKAYIDHESDSLILDVINYYSSHEKDLYPEALYYAGRVYSDLGDFPTALKHFHDALDRLHDTKDQLDLKSRILSQTGRLLNTLSLFDEAIPYIEESISIGKQTKDTISTIHNLQLLGATQLRSGEYNTAEESFKESLTLAERQPYYHAAKSRMYIAATKSHNNEIDSALYYIRNTVDSVVEGVRNKALAYASDIYLQAGVLDTAYIYAYDLITNNDDYNKEVGYQTILSPELLSFSTQEQINQYISEYRTILVSYYNENQIECTINQQNSHNYQLHVREREIAERRNRILMSIATLLIIAFMLSTIIILYLRNKNKSNIIKLRQALDSIESLKAQTEENSCPTKNLSAEASYSINADAYISEQHLREKLQQELMELHEKCSGQSKSVPMKILNSDAYKSLQCRIDNNGFIADNDDLWAELEQAVLTSSPQFRHNLQVLTLGKLTTIDIHTAILIKCGVKPSQMTSLLNKSNGAIISRRESLCKKMLGEKKGVQVIDSILRLM